MYSGLFIGKVPINEVITFFSEYLPFSSFLDVPVFPPTFNPITLAFLPVPESTICFNNLLTLIEVSFFKIFFGCI